MAVGGGERSGVSRRQSVCIVLALVLLLYCLQAVVDREGHLMRPWFRGWLDDSDDVRWDPEAVSDMLNTSVWIPKQKWKSPEFILSNATSLDWLWSPDWGDCCNEDEEAEQEQQSTGPLTLLLQYFDLSTNTTKTVERTLDPRRTGVIVMDMWDHHCCIAAEERLVELVEPMNRTLWAMRQKGFPIFHIPHGVVGFYSDWSQRFNAERSAMSYEDLGSFLQRHNSPIFGIDEKRAAMETLSPPVTIDNNPHRTCGCRQPPVPRTRQIPGLDIAPQDFISDSIHELLGLFLSRRIRYLVYVGVHANICVLWYRQSSMLQLKKFGFRPIFVRDLTDTLDERHGTNMTHVERNDLHFRFMETYFAPSTLSQHFFSSSTPTPTPAKATPKKRR